MTFKSLDNKFLVVMKGVTLTEYIDPVIESLEKYFEEAQHVAVVTSGKRDAEDQLRIIRNALFTYRIADDYPEAFKSLTGKHIWEGKDVYNFQPAWSKLLSIGFIVNPPFPAKVLMDYYRPGSTENRKGQIIGASPHFRGTAFDISGGKDGVDNEYRILQKAIGKVKGLKGFLLERNNNCLHVDCQFIDMENYL